MSEIVIVVTGQTGPSGVNTASIDDLTDVTITAAASGDILRHNGTAWVDAVGTTHFEAAGTVATHEADTTSVHGIADTATLYRSGGTDVAIADGGTGASVAATALSNLGGQPLDSDLTAVAALATNGLVARTGTGTASTRTITGTTNLVTVTNGDGVSGNPTLTVGSNVYQSGGTDVAVVDGGTGASDADAARVNLSAAPVSDRQFFDSSGTWTKPTGNFTRCRISGTGPGGPGASGRKGAAGTVRCGGGGGGGGGQFDAEFLLSDLPATLTVTIGALGTVGAAQATDSTNGNNGVNGGNTTVSGSGISLLGAAGGFGSGGTNAAGTGGNPGSSQLTTSTGANASGTGGAGTNAAAAATIGGASGGGITTGNVFSIGGVGRSAQHLGGFNVSVNGGQTDGATGVAQSAVATVQHPPAGRGGSGGASSVLGNAGAGGTSTGYGAGGGGGGASVDAVGNSGAGSQASPSCVLVICY